MRKFCAIDKLQVGVDKVVYETGPNCYGRGEVVSVSPAMFARRTRLVLDYGPELGGLKVVEHNATDQVAIHDPQPDDPLC